MKRFLVCAVISAAMLLMISCGGDSSTEENNNAENNGNGGNTEENNNDNGCTKITPEWTNVLLDDPDSDWCEGLPDVICENCEEDDESLFKEGYTFIMNGSYTPKTGNDSKYDDYIGFSMTGYGSTQKEYNFSSTKNALVAVYEDINPDVEDILDPNAYSRAYIAVGGTVKINSFDCENHHISLSFNNVRLEEATLEENQESLAGYNWNLTGSGKCLFIESSSFDR